MPDFVASSDKVDNLMDFSWALNMQVKMATETLEFSRVTHGSVSGTVTDFDSHSYDHDTSASFQGARLDQNDSSDKVFIDPVENVLESEPILVSRLANNGNSISENLSPSGQNSVHELVEQQGYHSSTMVVVNSFKPFGKAIHIANPVERGVDNSDMTANQFDRLDVGL
ncbi:auxin response factor 17 [Olea europaea subsp. europaea]|uniref:Auxin response factor 17 n=1 Tax=Olea europaea subsp. europaea TaxID=158383 RepID=A0A8S0T7K4_OLEEU|nr:auxin response factor 17 [Olea europaea subsp. europaea]